MTRSVDLGTRLRAAREDRGKSLRGVAQAIGVSPSLLSQVENGHIQPSVPTLYALVTHLEASLDEVLGVHQAATLAPEHIGSDVVVVQKSDDNAVAHMGDGVTWEGLAHAPGASSVSGYLVTYEHHTGDHGAHTERLQHVGSEYGVIVKGELTLYIRDETHQLQPGDSVHFDSMIPHLYVNHGDEPVTGVWYLWGQTPHDEIDH
jgi:quercetin dioxygenase-like cupin family protein/DNA-binding XRE family transcriptional regulator